MIPILFVVLRTVLRPTSEIRNFVAVVAGVRESPVRLAKQLCLGVIHRFRELPFALLAAE